jgi:hypothetical protein
MSPNSYHDHLGLIELAEEAYHAHPAISKSGLDRINISPAHYKAWKEAPPEPTDAMLFGTACHRLILEPERFDSTVALVPNVDRRTKDGKALWDAFQAANTSKILLKADQFETLRGMMEAWQLHPSFQEAHEGAKFEPSAFWTEPFSKLLCKARPDILNSDGTIWDLKTTDCARRRDFERAIANFRYHVQAAWYLDGIQRAADVRCYRFKFIVIEKKPPFGIAIYEATEGMIADGRRAYQEDFGAYAHCMRTNSWPSYPTEAQPINLPAWAIA